MRIKNLLFTILLFWGLLTHASAQNVQLLEQSDVAAWYKITDEEAEQIYQNQLELTDESLLHTPAGIFPKHPYYPKGVKWQGYYLTVWAKGEKLEVELRNFQSISVQILNHQKGYSLRVVDSMGILQKEAEVYLNGKHIPFDEDLQTFFSKKKVRNGFLKVKAQGETVFYDLDKEYSYRPSFFYTKFGRIIKSPYRLVRNIWWKIKHSIKVVSRSKNRQYQGYIACNQPKYQPFDTVKVKAFIANKRGKPLKKPLEARLYKDGGKALWKQTVEPNGEGNYTVELVLGDTLQLDKAYDIGFYEVRSDYENRHIEQTLTQSFRLEDYELDAIEYSFKSNQTKYRPGDSIEFHLSAKYKTGMYVPDAQVKLTARTKVLEESQLLKNFQANEVFVKDTIWTLQRELNASDTTLIYFPLEVLPQADSEIWIDAEFTDSTGELQEQSITFEVAQENKREGCLQLRLEGEYIVAECVENGQSVPHEAALGVYGENSEIMGEKEVQLPYKERINSSIADYSLDSKEDDAYVELYPKDFPSNVRASSYRANDSIYISIQNLRQIPVYYSIYTKRNLLTKGETQEAGFVWKQRDTGREHYFMAYNYLWGDIPVEQTQSFPYPKSTLDIEVEQPNKIRPGEQVQVKLKVKNRADKAASKVNLLAMAVNGKFEKPNNFSGPYLRQKNHKIPKKSTKMELDIFFEKKGNTNMTHKWLEKLKLEDRRYYKMRFPFNGLFLQMDSIEEKAEQDTFYRAFAQFAPFLVKNGQVQPIYLIYCNNRLVYYYELEGSVPYSFVGQEGYNKIEIRGRDYSYIIDSIELKKGHKLTFSIDELHYSRSNHAQHISRHSTKPELDGLELRLLNEHIFVMDIPYQYRGRYFVFQDVLSVQPIPLSGYRSQYLGPFNPQEKLTVIQTDGFQTSFNFEGGFRYQVFPRQQRLYGHKRFTEPFVLPENVTRRSMNDLIFHPKDIVTQNPTPLFQYDSKRHYTQRGNGMYLFDFETSKKQKDGLWAVIVASKDSSDCLEKFADTLDTSSTEVRRHFEIYNDVTRKIHDLPPNDYQLILVRKSGAYLQQDFRIEPHTLTYQKIDSHATFTPDSSLQFLKTLLEKRNKVLQKLPKMTLQSKPKSVSYSQAEMSRMKGNGTSGIRGQIVDEETGEPLIGVNVVVKGTTIGTVTDFEGYYKLNVSEGNYTLSISYIGYSSADREVSVNQEGFAELNFDLQEDTLAFDEVVVVGYGTDGKRKKEYIGGIVVSASRKRDKMQGGTPASISLLGRTAGVAVVGASDEMNPLIRIKGENTLSSEGMLYLVDGIPISKEAFEKLNVNDLESVEVLKDEAATAIYGSRAGNGLIVITTKKGGLLFKNLSIGGQNQLRSNFQDYAYWQPNLMTDQNGEAYFTVTFPDNATQWQTTVLGMNDKQQGGIGFATTNAYKEIMGELSVPRFLVEGDQTSILGKSLNYTSDSIDIQTTFKLGEDILQSNRAKIKAALVEKAVVNAPSAANQDSISLTYSLQLEDGYGDGEKRQIPIFRQGIEEVEGDFYVLEGDTSISLSFNEKMESVQVYAQNSVLELLEKDLDYLQSYPYGCNEQNASRLMALLLEKEVKQYLNQPFKREKDIRKTLKKLERAQNEDGSWGWWRGNPSNSWMTWYITRALRKAHEMDYFSPALDRSLRLITNRLSQFAQNTPSLARDLNPSLVIRGEGRQLLQFLSLLSEIGQNADYEKYLQKVNKTLSNSTLYDQLQILKIRQIWKLPHDLQLLDTIRQVTTFGNYYWGKRGYGWHDNAIQNTLLAFDIYQRAGRKEDCQKIIGYLLERRGRKHWRNTFETAQVLQAILPTLLEESGGTLEGNQLMFSGAFDQTINEFPFEAKVAANQTLEVKKTGSTPIYLTTYQSFWNPQPQAKSDIFAVNTAWQNAQKDTVQTLAAAERATLQVEVEVKESAEYVMIEVPIPAGCSYGNKGKNSNSHEVHREYFKHKVAIFCQELPIGKHTFKVPLEARYTGNYTVNPAKVEQMYFPVFYGRNELKKMEVE